MSDTLAGTIALLLYGVALVPLTLVAVRDRMAPAAALVVVGAVAAISFLQTGDIQRRNLASTDVTKLLVADPTRGKCDQVFSVLRKNNVILATPTRDQIEVNGSMWDRMPPELQESVLSCARDVAGAASQDDTPKVVRR